MKPMNANFQMSKVTINNNIPPHPGINGKKNTDALSTFLSAKHANYTTKEYIPMNSYPFPTQTV